jgi:hypothetical protein
VVILYIAHGFCIYDHDPTLERGSYTVWNGLTTFYAKREVTCAIRPGAEAVRGWRALNRPTVCTVGAVAPGAGFLRLK